MGELNAHISASTSSTDSCLPDQCPVRLCSGDADHGAPRLAMSTARLLWVAPWDAQPSLATLGAEPVPESCMEAL